jgi:hypothetical protein
VLHRILERIVIKVFQDTPQMAAVGLNNNGFLGEAGYQFQMADQEFFFKFPVSLIDQLNKVDIGQLDL